MAHTLAQLLRLQPADWDGSPPSQSAEFEVFRTQVAVATTQTQLLKPNPRRISWQVVNLSGATIFLDQSPGVNSTNSTPLFGTGASATTDLLNDRSIVFRELFAIASVAGNVQVMEVVLQAEN